MSTFYRVILPYFLLSLFAIENGILGADDHKSHVLPSPQKSQAPSYGGIEHKELIKRVKVSSCVSLGGSCIDRINSILKNADQFIVSFMYRFNSPTLIKTLADKRLDPIPVPVVVFLDYNQTYESSSEGSHYPHYVRRLIESVPTSLVKLKGRSFHQKIIISKETGKEAVVIVGSANATFEADNEHSEDIVIIQSNALADFYLGEFGKLMRMNLPSQESSSIKLIEPQIKVFHEHRIQSGESNIDFLDTLRQRLFSKKDKLSPIDGHSGDIVSLGISTGFQNDEGTQKCLSIVNDALEAHNAFLFLFENFISLNEGLMKKEIGINLKNKTRKLIILDNNKHNVTSTQELRQSSANEILLFKPFSGGKFHHKLIIQYPINDAPIVYTGSFHISTNAIERNSENIIGIRSAGLADEYLASILLNSGLGEQPSVWRFISKHQRLRETIVQSKSQESLVLKSARKLLHKCKENMNRYLDRLERIETHLQSTSSDADQQNEISKHFWSCANKFEQGDDKLRAIEDLNDAVFKGDIAGIYWKDLQKKWGAIKEKLADIDELPEFREDSVEGWLEKMGTWIGNTKEEQKWEKLSIKEDLESIETIHTALNDLHEYKNTFDRLDELSDIISQILEK
jgi:phosphatidylserine/phosphatidylglycerophosphate/cardiolipin synthase-like enzyme